MGWINDILSRLTRRSYPDARAFNYPYNGTWDRLHRALSLSEGRAYTDALSTLDSIIPDNDNFSEEDATTLEAVYAIYSKTGTPLADRKLAILQKMAYPGTDAPRCNYTYIQAQLRAAGFDVYVYENRFFPGPVTKSPAEALLLPHAFELAQYGNPQYGDTQYGTTSSGLLTKCVNYIEEAKDFAFVVGSNYRSTFYISGSPILSAAEIPAIRKDEFRQLILQLKPAQTCAFLFINYT